MSLLRLILSIIVNMQDSYTWRKDHLHFAFCVLDSSVCVSDGYLHVPQRCIEQGSASAVARVGHKRQFMQASARVRTLPLFSVYNIHLPLHLLCRVSPAVLCRL